MAQFDQQRITFNPTITAGAYAPEEIVLAARTNQDVTHPIAGVSVLVESIVATAVIELWLLKVGGQASAAGDWFLAQTLTLAVGLQSVKLYGWRGAKIRVKSGGTAGAMVINASAEVNA